MALAGPFADYLAKGPFLARFGELRAQGDRDADCLWALYQRVIRGEVELVAHDWDGDPDKYLLHECHHDVRIWARNRGKVVFISATPSGSGAADPVEELL